MSSKPVHTTVHQEGHPSTRLPQIFLLAAVVFLAILILFPKQMAEATPEAAPGATAGMPVATELPEVQLMRALGAGQPTLAFFRSSSCDACKQMTSIVDQVYPEFAGTITLVEVDVYDSKNAQLLQQVGLRAIPTVILFDQDGNGSIRMGVVPENEIRQMLVALQKGG
jgi:thioredoxin-like negative regulator of GroEL